MTGCTPSGSQDALALPGFELEPRREVYPDPAAGPCDPLAVPSSSVELATPLLVSVSDDGTIYVADRVGLDSRLFAGADGILQRRGDFIVGRSDDEFVWQAAAAAAGLVVLRIDRQAWRDRALRTRDLAIHLVPQTSQLPIPAPAQAMAGEALQRLDPSHIDGWRTRSRPAARMIQYFAETEEGRWLLVTRTQGGFASPRVFFGPADAVRQRRLIHFRRRPDRGSTMLFDADGIRASVHLPPPCVAHPALGGPRKSGIPAAPRCYSSPTLELAKTELRLRPTALTLPDLEFICAPPTD